MRQTDEEPSLLHDVQEAWKDLAKQIVGSSSAGGRRELEGQITWAIVNKTEAALGVPVPYELRSLLVDSASRELEDGRVFLRLGVSKRVGSNFGPEGPRSPVFGQRCFFARRGTGGAELEMPQTQERFFLRGMPDELAEQLNDSRHQCFGVRDRNSIYLVRPTRAGESNLVVAFDCLSGEFRFSTTARGPEPYAFGHAGGGIALWRFVALVPFEKGLAVVVAVPDGLAVETLDDLSGKSTGRFDTLLSGPWRD